VMANEDEGRGRGSIVSPSRTLRLTAPDRALGVYGWPEVPGRLDRRLDVSGVERFAISD